MGYKVFKLKAHLSLFLILIIFGSSSFNKFTSASDTNCAELRSNVNGFQNQSLVIGDYVVLGNIADEYASANQNWNVSGYWSVSSGCDLTACQDAYLTIRCQTFGSSSSTPTPTTASLWKSASCKCNNKQCGCSNVYLKPSVCARAYFQRNGCNVCDAHYTEFDNSSPIFPEAWTDKIASFLIRPGCTLEVFDQEDFDGESEIIEGPFVENWSGTIMSYECRCNDDDEPIGPSPLPPTRPNNYPANIELPNTLNEIVSQLRQRNYNHPGLLAAFSSLTHGRSSKNAYILLIGSSGAGKSSAINNLLNSPNVTLEGTGESTTSEIIEFRIPIPVDPLGVSNSQLRIIDTPGLADTRGLENDALFLATLDEYLSTHEELSKKIPSLVLVFHHFPDNRFKGEGAKFVRMIRGLSNLHNRITDAKFSNVLFVFSHYCKESSRQIRRNPGPRLLQFKEVIEDYGLFPKPIFTSVIENKGKDNYLEMINGNYELPNMEYFPANLLNKFDTITKGGQDIIANAIINAALREREKPKTFNMTETRFGLVSPSHSKVAKYMSILSSATFNVASTEISRLLADSFETMPTQLKTQFPNALSYLQKYFNVRNFRSKNDLPQTTVAILELLEGINMKDEAVVYLLESGLKLSASTFPQKVVAGYSFNALKDSVLPISPYKLDNNNNLKTSPIGFRLPGAITCTKDSNNFNLLQIVNTRDKYVRNRIESFGINMGTVASTELFTGLQRKIEEGYFVRDSSCSNNVCSFIASRYYKLFQFDLNTSAQLHPDFIKRVNNLTAFDESAYESINSWNAFFNDYGTHVVKSALGGGRIDIHVTYQSTISVDSLKNILFKTVEFTEDPKLLITGDKIDPARVLPSGATYSLIFHGGSPTYHSSNLAAQSLEDAIKIMKNWKKSLSFHPAIYPIHYVPIHQQVAQSSSLLGSQKSQIIQDATLRLFNSSLIYVAPTPDPKVLEEMARIKRENEEKLKQLAAEAKAKQEQAERERLAAIEEQKQRERDRQRREEQRRREEEELQRQLEKERQRILKEEEEALKRQEEEERKRQVQLTLQLLINRIQQEIRQQELQRQLDAARNRQRASCLKQGTKILLADFTEKPVQELDIGDVLLDKDLKPTRVLGMSYEFLLNQKFYGFDNQSFFFTDTHLFVGPKENVIKDTLTPDQDLSQLYTTSKANLFAQNPLLEYLNVKDFDENKKFNDTQEPSLFHFDPLLHDKPVERDINVFLEPKIYPADTPIYFIQVDSPTGTYFAEGYVCRHEIPPLELWPNTIATLFSIFGTRGFKKLAKLPYSLETIYLIDGVSDNVQMRVTRLLDEEFLSEESTKHLEMNNYCKKQSLANFNLDEMIGKIFNNPTMAALAMELYGGTGSIMSKYLDNPNIPLSECQLQKLQDRIANVIGSQLDMSNM